MDEMLKKLKEAICGLGESGMESHELIKLNQQMICDILARLHVIENDIANLKKGTHETSC